MSNIIAFPNHSKVHPPQNELEMKAHVEEIRHKFINAHAVDFAFDVFRELEGHGFDLQSKKDMKYDLVLISESIKSAMCQSMGIVHPLQEFAQNIINLKDSDIDFDFDFESNEDD
jgi:hypothetical protein|tara:strand:- start:1149 stop:1493 length:345 start_codon:yes stop_codon:yes gene_type:complete